MLSVAVRPDAVTLVSGVACRIQRYYVAVSLTSQPYGLRAADDDSCARGDVEGRV